MSERVQVGLLSPGAMGASVAAAASAGYELIWASEGRSARTRERAESAGLVDVVGLRTLVDRSDVILSVCPPGRAMDVAEAVAAAGFSGLYTDANAVSPGTARAVADRVGTSFVDGSIVGPPARKAGTTRLYLAGDEAERVAAIFAGGPLQAVTVDGAPGAASALKACYAAWTKGSAALLLAIRALAAAEGVEGALMEEWSLSKPDLEAQSERHAQGNAPKAWRFVDEMHEIATTFADAGLPAGFHQAAADVYGRLDKFKDADDTIALGDVVASLLQGVARHRDTRQPGGA